MKVERRIRALEAKMITESVTLYFADGTTREICGRGCFLLELGAAIGRGVGELRPGQAERLELIRQSVAAREPGGGHMVEVIRSLLQGPSDFDPRLDESE